MDRDYIKYDPNKNLPTNEAILLNQIEKNVKALESAVCNTKKAKKIN